MEFCKTLRKQRLWLYKYFELALLLKRKLIPATHSWLLIPAPTPVFSAFSLRFSPFFLNFFFLILRWVHDEMSCSRINATCQGWVWCRAQRAALDQCMDGECSPGLEWVGCRESREGAGAAALHWTDLRCWWNWHPKSLPLGWHQHLENPPMPKGDFVVAPTSADSGNAGVFAGPLPRAACWSRA